MARETAEQLRLALLARLAEFHETNPDLMGLGQERLRLALEPRLPASAFRAFLQDLARAGEVALDGAWVRLAGHVVQLTPADERLWDGMRDLIGGAERFRPPRVRDLAGVTGTAEGDVRRVLKLTARCGRTDEVAHDHFFLRRTVAEMVDIVTALSGPDRRWEFTASQFRDKVENGRKVAIQILEFLDRHGVTLRRGDLRRVNPHRLDLFRASAGEEPAGAHGGVTSPVGRPDFKSGRGRETVPGGFDSHPPPPPLRDRA